MTSRRTFLRSLALAPLAVAGVAAHLSRPKPIEVKTNVSTTTTGCITISGWCSLFPSGKCIWVGSPVTLRSDGRRWEAVS